jgi:serine/threonine-protein kinase
VKVDAGQIASAPQLLPGGRAILFTLSTLNDPETRQIVVQSLDTGVRRVVVEAGTDAQYVPTGHLVYALAGSLLAVPFDVVALTPTGGPVPLMDDVAMSPDDVMAYFAVSNDGTLVYVPKDAVSTQDRTPVWVDRQGRETSIEGMRRRRYTQPRLSPDGTRIALVAQEQNTDIWIWDLSRETLLRLTSERTWDQDPVWTPDGQSVIYSSGAAGGMGPRNLLRRAADATGAVEQLMQDASVVVPKALTPDGKGLVIIHNNTASGSASIIDRGDVLLLPLVGGRLPQPLVRTQFSETNADLSPDGRWLVYQSTESGQEEIFVRPFPNVEAGKWLVARGSRPLWARSGRELFYLLTGAVMSVSVTTTSTIAFGKPTKLFEGPYFFGPAGRAYDAAADGQRFLMIKLNSAAGGPSRSAGLVVVLNWFEELRRRAPTEGSRSPGASP